MDAAPIIIKKKKSGGGDGHHGGAWKVAYADFVTAMMAFFLLMWLLNATSEEQRKGLADYFDPSIPLSRNSSGGSGMMGGDEMLTPPDTALNEKEGDRDPRTRQKTLSDPSDQTKPEGDVADTPPREEKDDTDADKTAAAGEKLDPEAEKAVAAAKAAARAAEAERAALDAINRQIETELAAIGQEGLSQHFNLRVTPDGLVIEIVDLTGEPLFGSGAAEAQPILRTLIGVITPILGLTSNDIAVVGHTDATPFNNRSGYSNWELSADRANEARRMLAEAGLDPTRITRVSGRAATDPISDDPRDPRNRRIAVTLLRRPSPPDDGG